ncbi:MAG: EamA family transporter [Pseudomonadota bacterium]
MLTALLFAFNRFHRRSTTTGAAALVAYGALTGSIGVLSGFDAKQWIAGIYLGIGGGAFAFIFWVMALQRSTPTQVANTMTVNPIAAAMLAAVLVGEPVTINLVAGLIAVFAGIWIATSSGIPTAQSSL